MLTFRQSLGNIDDLTYAEAQQLFQENEKSLWDHTAAIIAWLIQVNKSKKGKKVTADDINPWTAKNQTASYPLNSKEGFEALSSLAGHGKKG